MAASEEHIIDLKHVSKRFGDKVVLDDISLYIRKGEFVTLLGPSGCGKTTTLRLISGFLAPDEGEILLDGKDISGIPPYKRPFNTVFQRYALFPHLDVYENIAFGLKLQKVPEDEIEKRVKRVLKLVSMSDYEDRDVDSLSGGQQQRVAIARALVNQPKILLLDEPLAALDLKMRKDMQIELKEMHKKLGITFIYVTHDQEEALTLSDTIVVMNEGKIQQIGTPIDIYNEPGVSVNENGEVIRDEKATGAARKLTKEEIKRAVDRVSAIVKIGQFMDRYPSELSGGQQQRVAIARTLAPEPSVLFMDEPLSNLDAKLRLEMRSELQRLHLETGSTFVYVTHDQMEAMTLATRICLIDNGLLQQYDAPLTVYGRPNNTFVADFVGNPAINFIEGKGQQAADGSIAIDILGGKKAVFRPKEPIVISDWYAAQAKADDDRRQAEAEKAKQKGYVEKGNKDTLFRHHIAKVDELEDFGDEYEATEDDFVIGVRPEFLDLRDDGAIEGEIYSAMPTGMETTVKVQVGEFLLTGVVFGGVLYELGQKVRCGFRGDDIVLFSRKNGRFIAQGSLTIE